MKLYSRVHGGYKNTSRGTSSSSSTRWGPVQRSVTMRNSSRMNARGGGFLKMTSEYDLLRQFQKAESALAGGRRKFTVNKRRRHKRRH